MQIYTLKKITTHTSYCTVSKKRRVKHTENMNEIANKTINTEGLQAQIGDTINDFVLNYFQKVKQY